MSESLVTLNGLKAYDVKKGTAVVDVDALPETVENRSYRKVGDTELETQAFIKDTEVATKAFVNNITVDGRTVETGTQNYISNAVIDVTELPDTVDNKVYRDTENDKVYAKDTELATKDYVDDTYIPIAEKAEPNGVATLDANGHVPVEQMPTQALIYKGSWDASSGTFPTGEFILGDFYIVSVEGTISDVIYRVGDWIIWDGSQWTLSRNTNAVASVNEMTGAVMLYADILPVADDDNTNTKDYIDAITVDGNSQTSQNIVSKAVVEVAELPATPLNKVYNVTTANGTEVYSKGVKLVTDSSSVKSVNEQTPDANGDITIDGDTINATYESETDTLNTILTKVGKVKTVDGVLPDTDGNIQSIAVEEVDTLPATPENKVYVVDDGNGGYNIYAKDILIKNGEYVPLVDEMPASPSAGDVVCWNGAESVVTKYVKFPDSNTYWTEDGTSTSSPEGELTSSVSVSVSQTINGSTYTIASVQNGSGLEGGYGVAISVPGGLTNYLSLDFENNTWALGSSGIVDNGYTTLSGNLLFVEYTAETGYTKGHLYKYNGSTWDDVYTNTSTTADITEANALANIGTSAGATQQAVNSAINTAIGNKQDTLTAGTGITITDNVISSSGGVAASVSGSTLYLTW